VFGGTHWEICQPKSRPVTDTAGAAFADALGDRYVLERELGRGGMATVYLARDLKHDRAVALKVLRAELSAILGAERFLREIRLTAGLQHPHILPLLDSGEAGGLLYYVMPYVEGESLRQRLEREGQLPAAEAVRLTAEVAEALDYAHEQGIIHRDIKPENILLSRGHALVADFGIALAVSHAGKDRLTETGLSLGTPAYMSPEQATANPKLDGRSDQYSLACVAYEMLAGEPPYTGPTAQAIIAKRFSEPVPHLSTVREVPPSLDQAVTRALARAPADRFASTTAFAGALSQSQTSVLPGWTRRVRSIRPVVLTTGGGLLMAALAVVAVLRFQHRQESAPTVPTQRQFTFTARANEPALSPDGQSIAYVVERRSLVREELAGSGPIVLVRSAGWLASPRWSPDGHWLYFTMLRDGVESAAIYRIPVRGGAPIKVVDAIGPIDLSPDGRTLVRAASDTLTLHNAVTGMVRARFPTGVVMDQGTWEGFPQHVAWSPDGRWIASVSLVGGDVMITSADGRRRLLLAHDRVGPIRWSPKGDALYYLALVRGGTDLMRARFDNWSGVRPGEERVALSGMPNSRDLDLVYDLARQGNTLAYVKGPQSQHVWAFKLDAGRDTAIGRRLSEDSRAYDWPAVSRDGRILAVVQYDENAQGNFFLVSTNGGNFTRLTDGPGWKSNPSWAPDGIRFAYVLSDSTGSRLVLTDRSGQRLHAGTTAPYPQTYFRTSWSADGRTVLYLAERGRTLVALEVSQGTEAITPGSDSIGQWVGAALSPDGREVIAAEVHQWQDAPRIWHGIVGHGSWTRITGPPGDNMPLLWRDDGWIYLFNDRDGADRVFRSADLPAIWRLRPDGSRQEFVAWLPAECRFGFVSMSGDARRVACAVLHQEPDIWLVSNFDAGR
jgi:serine/threonine protein kinase/Tol biopolymer transport system component